MSKRRSRLCTGCRKAKTQSITRLCVACRPDDAIPAISSDREMVSFAGLTLTENQAIALADKIIDVIERRKKEWTTKENQ